MELKEFQGLALRTESQIQGIQLNRANLITLLKVVVEVTEILDGIKKAAFYNKTAKLEDGLATRLFTLAKLIEGLSWQTSGRGPVGAIMDPTETISNVDPRVFHGILGIITESGELAAALLKSVEDPNHTVDAVNIQEEMSDIAWYKAILHDVLGLDWNQGLINVINKLRIRYPEKYSDEAADARNLDAERAALEVGVTPTKRDFFAERVELERGVNVSDMTMTEAGVVSDFNNGGPDQNRFFGGLASERAILDKYNHVPVTEAQCIETDGRRIFYVDVPEGVSSEKLQEILENLRSRVLYVDGHK